MPECTQIVDDKELVEYNLDQIVEIISCLVDELCRRHRIARLQEEYNRRRFLNLENRVLALEQRPGRKSKYKEYKEG